MRKSYGYYVNGKQVSRQEMMDALKRQCLKTMYTIECTEDIAVDVTELDEKKFNSEMRAINNGIIVCFSNGKTFYRKECKKPKAITVQNYSIER